MPEEKIFVLDNVMMPLFIAKKMVGFANDNHLTIEKKEMRGLTKEEMKDDMMAVRISFTSKSNAHAKRIVKEIRRLAAERYIFIL